MPGPPCTMNPLNPLLGVAAAAPARHSLLAARWHAAGVSVLHKPEGVLLPNWQIALRHQFRPRAAASTTLTERIVPVAPPGILNHSA